MANSRPLTLSDFESGRVELDPTRALGFGVVRSGGLSAINLLLPESLNDCVPAVRFRGSRDPFPERVVTLARCDALNKWPTVGGREESPSRFPRTTRTSSVVSGEREMRLSPLASSNRGTELSRNFTPLGKPLSTAAATANFGNSSLNRRNGKFQRLRCDRETNAPTFVTTVCKRRGL